MLSGDDAGLLRYWKPNLECLKSAQAHGEAIQGIACAPSDLKFVSCSDDSSIKVTIVDGYCRWLLWVAVVGLRGFRVCLFLLSGF